MGLYKLWGHTECFGRYLFWSRKEDSYIEFFTEHPSGVIGLLLGGSHI